MVYAHNAPTIFSSEARYFAPLYRRLLLDTVLTTFYNIRVKVRECPLADASLQYGVETVQVTCGNA